MKNYEDLRAKMVQEQIVRRGIKDKNVLNALLKVPRHLFVAQEQQPLAYKDRPLPIDCGQTISQPYIVGLMCSLLELQPTDTVLEIGTGSGYLAAVLSCLAALVFGVEQQLPLVLQSRRVLEVLGMKNVLISQGDGSTGLPQKAPFDAIVISAAAPALPLPLSAQLKPGGRLVLPIGDRWEQRLQRWRKTAGGEMQKETFSAVSFVPLRGEFGWQADDW